MSEAIDEARRDLNAALDDLEPDLRALEEAGGVLLEGDAIVQIITRVSEVSTPEEAVVMTIQDLAMQGFKNVLFGVIDAGSGETYYVRNGELVRNPAEDDDDDTDSD